MTSSEVKTQASGPAVTSNKKAVTSLESFFRRAAEKQKIKETSLSSPTATTQTSTSNSPSAPSSSFQTSLTTAAEPFYKQKSLNNPLAVIPAQNVSSSSEVLPDCLPAENPGCAVSEELPDPGSSQTAPAQMDSAQHNPSTLALNSKSALDVIQKATTSTSLAAEDQVPCEKCGVLIPVWEMPEHADYHFAVELQKSFLQPHPSGSPAVPTSSPQKRTKSPLASSNKRPRPQGMQTLESFFKPLTH